MSRQAEFANRIKVFAYGADLSDRARRRIDRGGLVLPFACVYTLVGVVSLLQHLTFDRWFRWDYRITGMYPNGEIWRHPWAYACALTVFAWLLLIRWMRVPAEGVNLIVVRNSPLGIGLLVIGAPMWSEVTLMVTTYLSIWFIVQVVHIGLTGRPWMSPRPSDERF